MSSHSTSASAAAAANQALIALVAWLTEMVQDVIRLPLQEEKMELSWKIAHEVNDMIHTDGKEASYVPPGLLSLAAEIFHAQRRTTQLVEVPDWTCLGNNQDMCMKHPLYSKTLGAAPPITSAAPVATAPVPAPPPAPTPAPAPPLAPAPDRPQHGNIDSELMHGKTHAKAILDDIDQKYFQSPTAYCCGFLQWTGDDSKALMKVYLPAIEGHIPDDMVQAPRASPELRYTMRTNVVTDDTLAALKDALGHFHTYRCRKHSHCSPAEAYFTEYVESPVVRTSVQSFPVISDETRSNPMLSCALRASDPPDITGDAPDPLAYLRKPVRPMSCPFRPTPQVGLPIYLVTYLSLPVTWLNIPGSHPFRTRFAPETLVTRFY
ncbi:hypothetical protein EDB19DRAFT_1922423 [Suillus lakei]|nr:hypothetical protein EDB19DRAFT_1922423 [Suillus lakei]